MSKDYEFQIVTRDLSQFSKVYLVPIADLHEGAYNADHEVSDGYIQWIAEHENAFTVLNGDLMNCAWKDSTPELFEDLITPDDAYGKLRARLEPIKDKIIMITRGGHEEAIFRKVGHDYMAQLAYDLGNIPYRPNGGMFAIKLSKNGHFAMFTGWMVHGWGGARTLGAKVKKAQDLVLAVDVDIYILSHDHTQNIHRENIYSPPRSKFSTRRDCYMQMNRKIFINTGGFADYRGYVRRKGYSPQDLGTPRIRIELKKGKDTYYKDYHASI